MFASSNAKGPVDISGLPPARSRVGGREACLLQIHRVLPLQRLSVINQCLSEKNSVIMSTNSNIATTSTAAVVAVGQVVHLCYWARRRDTGELLQYGEDLRYLHGGFGGVFPRVEQALAGLRCGERTVVAIEPADGYGERDPALLIVQSLHTLPEDEQLTPGSVLFGALPDGREHPYTVIRIDSDRVLLDGNHPWAGLPLEFTLEVIDIRSATRGECAAGRPLV
jgi:FKBP-type peptidyl-prolyl cis-trans isomerase SlyD